MGDHSVTFAVRERTGGSLLVETRRLRTAGAARRLEQRQVDLTTVHEQAASHTGLPGAAQGRDLPLGAPHAPAPAWDLLLTTASPAAPGVADLLRAPSAAVIAAVTQVPSEVDLLRELAGGRPWGLVVPGFFAGGTDPAWWWQPTRARFTVAGPAAGSLRPLFAHAREAPLAAPLVAAAGNMSVVAGLHAAGFDLGAPRRSASALAAAATEARHAVAAGYGGPPPRPVRPPAGRAALRLLPRLAPFDVPGYLRTHFGGHAGQTARMLRDWIDLGRRHGLPIDALESLREAMAG